MTEGGSEEGGLEELVEFLPSRSSRSAIRRSKDSDQRRDGGLGLGRECVPDGLRRAAADPSCRRSTVIRPRKQQWAVNAYHGLLHEPPGGIAGALAAGDRPGRPGRGRIARSGASIGRYPRYSASAGASSRRPAETSFVRWWLNDAARMGTPGIRQVVHGHAGPGFRRSPASRRPRCRRAVALEDEFHLGQCYVEDGHFGKAKRLLVGLGSGKSPTTGER